MVACARARQIAQTDDATATLGRYLFAAGRRAAQRSIPPMTNHAAFAVTPQFATAEINAPINGGIAWPNLRPLRQRQARRGRRNAGAARSARGG